MGHGLLQQFRPGRARRDLGGQPQRLSHGRRGAELAGPRDGFEGGGDRAVGGVQGLGAGQVELPGAPGRVAHAAGFQAAARGGQLGGRLLGEAAGQEQFAVHGLGVGEDDGGREGRPEAVVMRRCGRPR